MPATDTPCRRQLPTAEQVPREFTKPGALVRRAWDAGSQRASPG